MIGPSLNLLDPSASLVCVSADTKIYFLLDFIHHSPLLFFFIMYQTREDRTLDKDHSLRPSRHHRKDTPDPGT